MSPLLFNRPMHKFLLLIFLFTLPAYSCITGEVLKTPTGLEYVCEELSPEVAGWRDPRGLVWATAQDCQEFSARVPAQDELNNFQTEMGISVSQSFCVKYVIHHYLRFPKTPAIFFEGDILDFYSTKKPYGEFSNFSGFPVYVDGEWWSTSEHYYQAQKYDSEELRNWVQFAPGPMEAANRGRDPRFPKRDDWDDVKDAFMEKVLFEKYTRHEVLRELILSTGNSHIYEHTANDCYWGDCGDRTGKNHLGLLLMKVRESIR